MTELLFNLLVLVIVLSIASFSLMGLFHWWMFIMNEYGQKQR